MSSLKKLVLLLLPFLASACVHSGYVHRSQTARNAFEDGNYAAALKWYETQKPSERDKLLFLLDRGTILHTAKRYEESIKVFAEAIDLSERLTAAHIPSKTGSLVTNDQIIPYEGEKFEKLLMHVYQVMNYMGLNQPSEALIEVRRIHTKFDDIFRKESKAYLKNAFASYVTGAVWEKNRRNNDAYIDYKTTALFSPDWPQLEKDLPRTARKSGMMGQYVANRKKLFPNFSDSIPNDTTSNEGDLLLLIGEGWIPEKYSTEQNTGLQVVPVPRYPDLRTSPATITLSENGNMLGEAKPLYRVDEAARETLSDNMPGIIARAIGRLAVKEGTAVAVGETVNRDLGIVLGFLFLATNEADLRSWLTLPRSFQALRVSLPAGTHTLTLKTNRRTQEITVDIPKNDTQFLSLRVF